MKFKPGDVLEIPEKYLAAIILNERQTVSYGNLIEEFSLKLHQSEVDFWDFILTIFPGIDNFECSYDRKKNTIVIKKETKNKLNIFQWTKLCKNIEKMQKELIKKNN